MIFSGRFFGRSNSVIVDRTPWPDPTSDIRARHTGVSSAGGLIAVAPWGGDRDAATGFAER
jgi:hypothetical protein